MLRGFNRIKGVAVTQHKRIGIRDALVTLLPKAEIDRCGPLE